jgi:ketosteroid isomerase-like protein
MQHAMTEERMAQLATELRDAKAQRDIARILSLYHPDAVVEAPGLGSICKGHDEIGHGLSTFGTVFPDYSREIEGAAKCADSYITWGTARVTLTGEFGGHAANGRISQVMTFVILRFLADRIVYEGHHWDVSIICRTSGLPADLMLGSNFR